MEGRVSENARYRPMLLIDPPPAFSPGSELRAFLARWGASKALSRPDKTFSVVL